MDGSSFDTLTRALRSDGSRRGVVAGVLSALGLLGVRPTTAKKKGGKGKGKGKRKRKSKRDHRCVPESSASTCAGRCGTWANNCGLAVTCPSCPRGQTCLVNGTCARPCTDGGCGDCLPTGDCFTPNAEGLRLCAIPEQQCVDLQPCNPLDTTGCPAGFACYLNCAGSARCVAVATCPAL